MKIKFFFFYYIALTGIVNAQAPVWQWAKGSGGNLGDRAVSTAVDNSGNVFVVGNYGSPKIIFGNDTLVNDVSLNPANDDIFLVKYDPLGNVVWARGAGGNDHDRCHGVSVDGMGNVYVVGYFDSPSIKFGNTVLTSIVGKSTFFIVKYDNSGNLIWAKAGSTRMGSTGAVCADAIGNAYVTGMFADSAKFGGILLKNTAHPTIVSMFLVKYDSAGNVVWAKSPQGGSHSWGTSISVNGNNEIFATGTYLGSYSQTLIFGSYTLNNPTTYMNFFIAKYNSSGTVLWARTTSGTICNVEGNCVSADGSGNVYATGYFTGFSVTIGGVTLINDSAVACTKDVFLVKYNSSGGVVWAKCAQSLNLNNYVEGNGVSTDPIGNVYLTGAMDGRTVFSMDTLTLLPANGAGLFVVKYDGAGNQLFAKGAGKGAVANSISSYANGYAYIAGTHGSPVVFDNYTLNYVPASNDLFVAKILGGVTGIIEESNLVGDLLVFPNPSIGKFSFINRWGTCDVAIVNVIGEKVYQSKGNATDFEIDISKQPNGIYFLQYNTEQERIVKKLVVSH